jgi:DHA2 family multidrug resistance protein
VRAVVIPGLVLMVFANWQLSHLSLSLPYNSLQIILALRGFSIGLCMQPLMVSALSEIEPRQLSQASALSTALRFVFSSLTVAIIATVLQTQATVHTKHLAEGATASSPIGLLIAELQSYFMSKGIAIGQAYHAAIVSVEGSLQIRGYLMAMQDTFLLGTVLAIVAIIATFFVRSRPAAAPTSVPLTEEERREAELAREEALLAV